MNSNGTKIHKESKGIFIFHFATAPSGPGPPDHWGFTITLNTPHSVRLLWTSDQPHADTSTWQRTTLTRGRRPWLQRDSNQQSQQSQRPQNPRLNGIIYWGKFSGPEYSHFFPEMCFNGCQMKYRRIFIFVTTFQTFQTVSWDLSCLLPSVCQGLFSERPIDRSRKFTIHLHIAQHPLAPSCHGSETCA
jgi:hypothetical protein